MAGKIEGKRRFDKRGSAMYARAAMLGEPHVVVEEQGGSGLRIALALMTVVALALAGAFAYGYFRYDAGQKEIARLTDTANVAGGSPEASADLDAARAEIARLESLLAAQPADDGDGADATSVGSDLAASLAENERLRVQQVEERAALEAARARIAALETELASNGADPASVDGADSTSGSDPLAELEAARIELRLAAGERDAAREQVDRLLALVAELEAGSAASAETAEGAAPDRNAELQAANDEIVALRSNVAELEAMMLANGESGGSDGDGAVPSADLRRRIEAQTIELAARDRMIEEAAGRTAQLEAEISELRQLTGSADELAGLQERLSVAEEDAREAGEQRLVLEQELEARDRLLLDAQAGILALEAELARAQEQGSGDLAGVQAELDSLRLSSEARITDLATERDAVARGRAELASELEAARTEAASAGERVAALETELAAIKADGESTVSQNQALLDELRVDHEREMQRAAQERNAALASMQSVVQQRDTALAELETVRTDLARARETTEASVQSAREERDTIQAQLDTLRTELATSNTDLSGEIASLTRERDEARAQIETLRTDLATSSTDLADEIVSLTQERDDARARLETMQAELSAARDEVANGISGISGERDAALAELEDLRSQLARSNETMTSEMETLRRERDEAQAQLVVQGEELAAATGAVSERMQALVGERDAARAGRLEVEEALAALKTETRQMAAENERLDTRLASLRAADDAGEATITELRAQLIEARERAKALEEVEQSWRDERSLLVAERDALAATLADAGNVGARAGGAAVDVVDAGEIERLEAALAAAQAQVRSLDERIADLTSERDAALESTSAALVAAREEHERDQVELQRQIDALEAAGPVSDGDVSDGEGGTDAGRMQAELNNVRDENAVLADELDTLRRRMRQVENLLVRYTPRPPEPAPR